MKVTFLIWGVAMGISGMVAGRSVDQILLAVKIAFLGLILGGIGGLIANAIEKYRDAKSVVSPLRRRLK
jgi:hypothetical protein